MGFGERGISRRGLLKLFGVGAVSVLGVGCDLKIGKRTSYTVGECRDLQNAVYGEAANQSRRGRKFITRMALNRVEDSNYPNSIREVVYGRNAFSCIFDKKNKNWKQAIGELPRNEYEDMIYDRCGEDVRAILGGERLGIKGEDKIVAYHDVSVEYEDLVAKEKIIQKKWAKKGKRYDGFWMELEPLRDGKVGRLIFYVPKKG